MTQHQWVFFSYFLHCPLWLRHLNSTWRQSTSHQCFSLSNICTLPTVSHLLNTRIPLWPLQTFRRLLTGQIQGIEMWHCTVFVIALKKNIFFRSSNIPKLNRLVHQGQSKRVADTAGSLGDQPCIQIRQICTKQPPEPPTVLLWRCRSCRSHQPLPLWNSPYSKPLQ